MPTRRNSSNKGVSGTNIAGLAVAGLAAVGTMGLAGCGREDASARPPMPVAAVGAGKVPTPTATPDMIAASDGPKFRYDPALQKGPAPRAGAVAAPANPAAVSEGPPGATADASAAAGGPVTAGFETMPVTARKLLKGTVDVMPALEAKLGKPTEAHLLAAAAIGQGITAGSKNKTTQAIGQAAQGLLPFVLAKVAPTLALTAADAPAVRADFQKRVEDLESKDAEDAVKTTFSFVFGRDLNDTNPLFTGVLGGEKLKVDGLSATNFMAAASSAVEAATPNIDAAGLTKLLKGAPADE
jgi:hypothetical protein